MYVPDLAPYPSTRWPSVQAVGWLDCHHTYTQGQVRADAVERLAFYRANPVSLTLGVHECDFCTQQALDAELAHITPAQRQGCDILWIFTDHDVVYVAPDLMYHYVTVHHYQPPQIFLDALLAGPLPDSAEYRARYKQFRHRKT